MLDDRRWRVMQFAAVTPPLMLLDTWWLRRREDDGGAHAPREGRDEAEGRGEEGEKGGG